MKHENNSSIKLETLESHFKVHFDKILNLFLKNNDLSIGEYSILIILEEQ